MAKEGEPGPKLKISMCEKQEEDTERDGGKKITTSGICDSCHSLGTSAIGVFCLPITEAGIKTSSLHMFCHHGVRRCQHSLMQQDRCWLLALRPDQVTQL